MTAGRPLRTLAAALAAVPAIAGATACGTPTGSGTTLRLGYLPNLTQATAIVGVEKGILASRLAPRVRLATQTYSAGPEAMTALLSGAVDAIYVGPGPTVNAWEKSGGTAIKVVAGAASGGVAFVVRRGINRPADLRGRTVATPQLGNTQDIALRYWLRQHGLTATRDGGGDVHVRPQANSDTVTSFGTGAVAGAWVPEPYASRLVARGGHVLVDERDLWPGGHFVTTNLVVAAGYLRRHRDVVTRLVEGNVAANAYLHAHPADARRVVSAGIGRITGRPPSAALLVRAWTTLAFVDDPIASSLEADAQHAEAVGLLDHVNLDGLYDLGPLNGALRAAGVPQATAP